MVKNQNLQKQGLSVEDREILVAERDALRTELKKAGEALKVYSNPKNWGNGGWEGHPDDIWRGVSRPASGIAKKALSQPILKQLMGEVG